CAAGRASAESRPARGLAAGAARTWASAGSHARVLPRLTFHQRAETRVAEPRPQAEPRRLEVAVHQHRSSRVALAHEVRGSERPICRRPRHRVASIALRGGALIDLLVAQQAREPVERARIRRAGADHLRTMVVDDGLGALTTPAI